MKTVLIAEDYADVRVMTKYMVRSLGYEVIEARDGCEAVEEARDRRPDLILMDIAMPLMNGITAARLIRDTEDCREVPIVAVTAYGSEYSEAPVEFGFDEVVQKPVDMENLGNLLRQYLEDDSQELAH